MRLKIINLRPNPNLTDCYLVTERGMLTRPVSYREGMALLGQYVSIEAYDGLAWEVYA